MLRSVKGVLMYISSFSKRASTDITPLLTPLSMRVILLTRCNNTISPYRLVHLIRMQCRTSCFERQCPCHPCRQSNDVAIATREPTAPLPGHRVPGWPGTPCWKVSVRLSRTVSLLTLQGAASYLIILCLANACEAVPLLAAPPAQQRNLSGACLQSAIAGGSPWRLECEYFMNPRDDEQPVCLSTVGAAFVLIKFNGCWMTIGKYILNKHYTIFDADAIATPKAL